MNCALCLKEGFHFHIVLENGWVKTLSAVSSDGSSIDIAKEDYTVGRVDNPKED
jgi:hypothetical protein